MITRMIIMSVRIIMSIGVNSFIMDVSVNESIEWIKQIVAIHIGTPVRSLVSGGIRLEDQRTLEDYGVTSEKTIILTVEI